MRYENKYKKQSKRKQKSNSHLSKKEDKKTSDKSVAVGVYIFNNK